MSFEDQLNTALEELEEKSRDIIRKIHHFEDEIAEIEEKIEPLNDELYALDKEKKQLLEHKKTYCRDIKKEENNV